jgi:uncharacterized membrane protein YozB (DUF420 family)
MTSVLSITMLLHVVAAVAAAAPAHDDGADDLMLVCILSLTVLCSQMSSGASCGGWGHGRQRPSMPS